MEREPQEVAEAERRLLAKAMRHLARYSASRAHLALLLRRHARKHLSLPIEAEPATIERVLDRCAELGWQDDARFAEGRARRLLREGRSRLAMRAHLAEAGIARPLADATLTALAQEAGDPERLAAVAAARRRRLGPWRPPEIRAERRLRDLMVMVRAGFGMELAREIIDAADPEALRGDRDQA